MTNKLTNLQMWNIEEGQPIDPEKYVNYDPESNTIAFTATQNCIWIELDDGIKSPESLLKWVDHMATKPWMNGITMRIFVRMVCRLKGWRLG